MIAKIVIAVTVVVLITIGFTAYKNLIVENVSNKTNYETVNDSLEYNNWSAGITDKVVSEFVRDKAVVITVQNHAAKEAINEYLNEKETPSKLELDKSEEHDDDARIVSLARRMHDYYCAVRGEDPFCNTVDTTR